MTASRFITMRITVAMLLALLTFGVAWPSDAQAGCAYSHQTSPRTAAAHLDRLALAGALSLPIVEAELPAPMPRCSGMHCSNDPAPTLPAGLTPGPNVEQWGYVAELSSCQDNSSSRLPSDDSTVRPERRNLSPFHPPR